MPRKKKFNSFSMNSPKGASVAIQRADNMNTAKDTFRKESLADADCCSDEFSSHGAYIICTLPSICPLTNEC